MPPPAPLLITPTTPHPFTLIPLSSRSSVQQLLLTVLDPLLPFFSPGRARVRLPPFETGVRFDAAAADLEGLLRPLWGLAALVAGEGDGNGEEYDLYTRMWTEGIRRGTDPEDTEFWGWSSDNDQRMVEMCPLGFALAAAPGTWWDALGPEGRANLERWLGNSINERDMPDTNWLWFRVFANLGLKKNGARYSQQRLDADLERLDAFYHGDGWSNDGPEGTHQMDYYSHSFAIHFLQLLYAKLNGDDDPARAAEFKRRARTAALDLAHYYDEEGRAIPFGRSVIYRFAMVSFWGALAYADVDLPAPLTWGMVKGIVLRNLRWWQTQRGVWSPAGTLTVGYSYANMYAAENYNSPGSPYWACLAFICLAVPETHPFWTSDEANHWAAPLPPVKPIPRPGHIVSNRGGHLMLLSSGQACGYPMKATHAKYGGFAYSSAFAFSVPPGLFTLEQYALASQLGLSDDGGEYWKTRRLSESALETRGRDNTSTPVLVSRWAPFPDVRVRTYLVPPAPATPNWHLRAHRIEAARSVLTADGAFAVASDRAADGRLLGRYDPAAGEGTSPRLLGNYDVERGAAEGWAPGSEGAFAVSRRAGAVGIRALEKDLDPQAGRRAMLVNADPNSNLVESRTTIPTLRGEVAPGRTVWYVSAIYARPASGETPEKLGEKGYLDGWDDVPGVPNWLVEEMAKGE